MTDPTPEEFVKTILRALDDEEEGIVIRKAPGDGGDRDYRMMQNTKVRGLLLAAGVSIEDEEDGETVLRKDDI